MEDVKSLSYDEKLKILRQPDCSPKILSDLASDPRWEIRSWHVAEHLNTPPEALTLLSKDSLWEVRIGVARNIKAPEHLMVALANDSEESVRITLVGNKSLSDNVICHLLDDKSKSVVENLISNRDILPPKAMIKLLKSKHKKLVLEMDQCPPEILVEYSKSRSPMIQESVAANPNCPLEILERMASKDKYLRKVVEGNPTWRNKMKNSVVGS